MLTQKNTREQHLLTQTDFLTIDCQTNLTLVKFENKQDICEAFKKHGVSISMDVHKNKSKKKFSFEDLDEETTFFLREYYRDDFDLYNSL